jgi:hypothetical protein
MIKIDHLSRITLPHLTIQLRRLTVGVNACDGITQSVVQAAIKQILRYSAHITATLLQSFLSLRHELKAGKQFPLHCHSDSTSLSSLTFRYIEIMFATCNPISVSKCR